MSTLSTRFGNVTRIHQQNPLSDDQLRRVAPSIFAEEKHDSRSFYYTYIPTIEVINGLRKEGFMPFSAVQSKTRIEGKQDFTKHMIRLRRPDQISSQETNEVILINSHDGTSSYQMLTGMFRFVCMNGMVSGDISEDIRIPHRGDIVNQVVEAAYSVSEHFAIAEHSRDRMKSIELTEREKNAFAQIALNIKYGEEEEKPVTPSQILIPKRYADGDQKDLWTTFNIVQENLIRGGQRGFAQTGRRVTTRPVTSIDNNVRVNRGLWVLADEMIKLKTA